MFKTNTQSTTIKFDSYKLNESQVKSLCVLLGWYNPYADREKLSVKQYEILVEEFYNILDKIFIKN